MIWDDWSYVWGEGSEKRLEGWQAPGRQVLLAFQSYPKKFSFSSSFLEGQFQKFPQLCSPSLPGSPQVHSLGSRWAPLFPPLLLKHALSWLVSPSTNI